MPQAKYWSLGGQTVAIVASVLFAFWIQAWWEERQERENAHRLLSSFMEEHQENLEVMKSNLNYRRVVEKTVRELLAIGAQEKEVAVGELDELLGVLFWEGTPDFSWGVLDNLIEGGRLELIENANLRKRLASLHGQKEEMEQTAELEADLTNNEFFAYFRRNASMIQIGNRDSAKRLPGSNRLYYDDFDDLSVADSVDHQMLVGDEEFRGLLLQKLWAQLDFVKSSEPVFDNSNELIEMIGREIGTSK